MVDWFVVLFVVLFVVAAGRSRFVHCRTKCHASGVVLLNTFLLESAQHLEGCSERVAASSVRVPMCSGIVGQILCCVSSPTAWFLNKRVASTMRVRRPFDVGDFDRESFVSC